MILRKGRLKKDQIKKIAEFTSSIEEDRALAFYDIRQSVAHARALKKAGYLSEEEFKEISSGLSDVKKKLEKDPGFFGSEHDDIHMAVESELGKAGEKLHAGRSRNDQVACDVRMYLRDAVKEIVKGLDEVRDVLEEKISEPGIAGACMPFYTHLQRAQPINLGTYLELYRCWFSRDKERFLQLNKRINRLPLGAAAGASTSIKTDRESVAKELGFEGTIDNSLDAVASRDHVIEFACACSTIGTHFSRMAEELILFASKEFSFIDIDESIAETSSIMPQKKNPDCLELIRSAAGKLNGNTVSILTIMKGLPLTYNRDLQNDRVVFDSARTVIRILEIMPHIIRNISFNLKRMSDAAREGFTDAADFAEYLVSKGMEFRRAHRIVGELVKEGIERGYENFSDYPVKEILSRVPRAEEDFRDIIKMEEAVARRIRKK